MVLFNIQHFSVHDGPGVRTVVFMKGCNLRCRWCHNPESQRFQSEILSYPSKCIHCGACLAACPKSDGKALPIFTDQCLLCGACADACYSHALEKSGYTMALPELMDAILEDSDIYRTSGGGVTFSGGEPLLQIDDLHKALTAAKAQGIHTAIETAVCVPWEQIQQILPCTDLFLCDLKAMDSQRHRQGTGVTNELILENIRKLSEAGADILLRTPLIPGFNDDEQSLRDMAEFVRKLPTHPQLQLLPFHNICVSKYDALGREFLEANTPIPEKASLEAIRDAYPDVFILNIKEFRSITQKS